MNESNDISMDELKEQAEGLNIEFAGNISRAKLEDKIKAYAAKAKESKAVKVKEKSVRELVELEQTKLIRVMVTDRMNTSTLVPGRWIMSGNEELGIRKEYVKYDVPWHIMETTYKFLINDETTLHRSKIENGIESSEPYTAKRYVVDILPHLTEQELKELGDAQRLRNASV